MHQSWWFWCKICLFSSTSRDSFRSHKTQAKTGKKQQNLYNLVKASRVMEAESAATELPLFPQEEWYEQVLRYGLYLGAAFQILCILAVIFDISPSKNSSNPTDSNNSAGESSSDEADSEDEDHSNQQRNRRRIERKKRR